LRPDSAAIQSNPVGPTWSRLASRCPEIPHYNSSPKPLAIQLVSDRLLIAH